jgi:hypothetical protein
MVPMQQTGGEIVGLKSGRYKVLQPDQTEAPSTLQ